MIRKLGLVALAAVGLAACGSKPTIQGGNNGVVPKPPVYPHKKAPAATTTTTSTTVANTTPWLTPNTPEWVAGQWVAAYKAIYWNKPNWLWTWVNGLKPYSTPTEWQSMDAPVQAAYQQYKKTGYIDTATLNWWNNVKATQETRVVRTISVRAQTQAGVTPTSEIVLDHFTYWIDDTAHPQGYKTQNNFEYLCMQKIGGKWLVDWNMNALDKTAMACNPVP